MSICAGEWRQLFLNGERWPAVWTHFERAKFLSADHKALFKFEGFGPYGAEVRERSARIAESGFGPQIGDSEIGYARYALIKDSMLCATDVSEQVLEQIAAYCAWRVQIFPAETDAADEIEQMVRVNASEALDTDVEFFTPRIERRVIVDGRMHPHEWRLTRAGRLLKFDAASHGDDHFFPGPTDIAWDLAGTIIEWDLNGAATEHFLETYRKASGDDPGNRLPPFLTAYALFRLGYCSMATESLRGTGEEKRFECEIHRYRATSFRSMAHLQSV
jgi:hypothetical protein